MDVRQKKIGSITVEHVKGHDYGPANWQGRPRVVQHTTEGSFESAFEKLRLIDTPTYLAGRDKTGKVRCVQFLDLGRTAGALEHPDGTGPTNSLCVAQIELVGFSQKTTWLPDPGVLDMLAHLYAELAKQTALPLKHIAAKRNRTMFESTAGVYGHADVPDQPAGHWDPGALDYVTLLAAAKRIITTPSWYEAAAKLSPLWAWMLWRDHGAPVDLRPPQIPARVPASWWPRFLLHRGV